MKFTLCFTLFSLLVLFACKNRNREKTIQTTPKDSTIAITPKQGFAGIEFGSKMDVACGMPLTAGVTDTAHFNGKVYGFCSKDCKNDFLKTPEAFLASKYRQ
jgi:YHS domain-containing protein